MRLSLRHVHPRHSCVALSWELQAAEAERQRRSGDAAAGLNHSTASSGRQGVRAPVSCVLLGNGGGLASEAAYQQGDKREGQAALATGYSGQERLKAGSVVVGGADDPPEVGHPVTCNHHAERRDPLCRRHAFDNSWLSRVESHGVAN